MGESTESRPPPDSTTTSQEVPVNHNHPQILFPCSPPTYLSRHIQQAHSLRGRSRSATKTSCVGPSGYIRHASRARDDQDGPWTVCSPSRCIASSSSSSSRAQCAVLGLQDAASSSAPHIPMPKGRRRLARPREGEAPRLELAQAKKGPEPDPWFQVLQQIGGTERGQRSLPRFPRPR